MSNLSEEEKKAIEYWKNRCLIQEKVDRARIHKLEKVIDKMAESWKQDDIRSKEEIIEYFYKKVEEEYE